MRLYQEILATGALIASLGLNGCGEDREPLEGIVKEEFGTAQRLIESGGALFGNESVKIGGLTYGLILETDQGEYTISVRNSSSKPILALAKAIEPGDRIRIIYMARSTTIGEDHIGRTYSNLIELIEKSER